MSASTNAWEETLRTRNERIVVLEDALKEIGGIATDTIYERPRYIAKDTDRFELIRELSIRAVAPGLAGQPSKRLATFLAGVENA